MSPLHGVQLNRHSSLRRIGDSWSLTALLSDAELRAFLQAIGREELVALLVPARETEAA
jgi:hypothetical protein